jgi:hypothetical protein
LLCYRKLDMDSIKMNVGTQCSLLPNASELSRASVEVLVSERKVRLTDIDEDAGLDLFCNVNGVTENSDVRGVIFSGDKIVLRGFPYPVEYDNTEAESVVDRLGPIFEDCTFYDAHEGALVRMFHFEGKWFMCTHRKLDAFRSNWSSKKSFGESFRSGLESEIETNDSLRSAMPSDEGDVIAQFQTLLNPDRQYMFLIRNNADNRIVCAAPDRPTIFHVGTFVEGALITPGTQQVEDNIHVRSPMMHNFLSLDEVFAHVEQADPHHSPGVIAFAPGNQQFKILNGRYRKLFEVRGNEPNILFRYLDVRMDPEVKKTLEYLYPESIDGFLEYENNIYSVAKNIFQIYKSRFMNGNRVEKAPPQEFRVLYECHEWHKENRTTNRVTREKVIEVLNLQRATDLNQMIKHLRIEQIDRNNVAQVVETRARSNTTTTPMIPIPQIPKPIPEVSLAGSVPRE